jgi:hypothetical protein
MAHHSPAQLILGVFATADRAVAVRDRLRTAERSGVIDIVHVTLLRRDQDGSLSVLQAGEPGGSSSLASILRLICGPGPRGPGVRRLSELAGAIPPGSSGIAALIEHRWLDDLRTLLESASAETLTEALKSVIAGALGEGRDLVVTAGAANWHAGPLPTLADLSSTSV